MALSRHFRVERQVPSYLLVLGAVLVGCFLLSIWLLIPSSEVIPEGSGLPLKGRIPTDTTLENRKTDSPDEDDSEKEHLGNKSGTEAQEGIQSEDEGPVEYKDSRASEEMETFKGETKNNTETIRDEDSEEIELSEGKDVVDKGGEYKGENKDLLLGDKNERLPEVATGAESELTMENKESSSNWSTQVVESNEEKNMVNATNPEKVEDEYKVDTKQVTDTVDDTNGDKSQNPSAESIETEQSNEAEKAPEAGDKQFETEQKKSGDVVSYDWKICKWTAAMDYIPCLDNKEAIKRLPSTRRFQHRERHCPSADKFPMCLVPLPKGYKVPIRWPRSRDEIWLDNVPHTKLVSYKKEQNWVKLVGDKLVFPGGGTQFKFGASKYIDSVEEYVADVAWGKHTRVSLDIGCGVASFGGSLFDRDVLTMSFAPKDEHEAQVQLALERGIPAISAVMGTQRLPFPSNAFDLAHCARCRIHWHGDGGKWLTEVNRVLRPGGYFVWSATPVYRKQPEDMDFWKAMVTLTESMCWKLTIKIKGLSSGVGFAIYQKPTSNSCYENRPINHPPICSEKENPDAAWYTPMENCMQKVPTDTNVHGANWPPAWPERLDSTPDWLKKSQKSLFGQPADVEFQMDAEHWRRVIARSYLTGVGIDWGGIRNVMDMKAGYGGFAAALLRTSVWVMNVVPIDEPDTLPVIFDRGLVGIYHDWCESFNTYPRTYDLLHVDHLFKRLVSRCKPVNTLLEMDRILRPQGWVIFREKSSMLNQILPIIESLHWNIGLTFVEGEEKLLVAQKTFWRPESLEVESK